MGRTKHVLPRCENSRERDREHWRFPVATSIPISGGKAYAIVDDQDAALILQSTWYLAHNGYAHRNLPRGKKRGGVTYMHRLIAGFAETSEQVDHIDGDKLNNRRANLRVANFHANQWNRKKTKLVQGKSTSSRYKGVTWDKTGRVWVGQITQNRRRFHLGRYQCEEEAARAYDAAAIQKFGEYARLNFPGEDDGVT